MAEHEVAAAKTKERLEEVSRMEVELKGYNDTVAQLVRAVDDARQAYTKAKTVAGAGEEGARARAQAAW